MLSIDEQPQQQCGNSSPPQSCSIDAPVNQWTQCLARWCTLHPSTDHALDGVSRGTHTHHTNRRTLRQLSGRVNTHTHRHSKPYLRESYVKNDDQRWNTLCHTHTRTNNSHANRPEHMGKWNRNKDKSPPSTRIEHACFAGATLSPNQSYFEQQLNN